MVGLSNKKKGVATSDKPDCLGGGIESVYLRFDSQDFKDDLAEFRFESEGSQILIEESDVWKTLEWTSIRRSQGPDHISGRLLKNCAVFEQYFHIHFSTLTITKERSRCMEGISSGPSGKSSLSKGA